MTKTQTDRVVASALVISCLGTPSLALAHVGHIGELAGHSHWVGVAALAGAAIVAGVAALKGRKKAELDQDDADTAQPETDAEAAR